MTSETCPRCGAAKHRGRCKGGGAVSKREPEAITVPNTYGHSLTVTNGHTLTVGPSYGFRASADPRAGELTLAQDRPDEEGQTVTMEIVLTREDAARLLDWVSRVAG